MGLVISAGLFCETVWLPRAKSLVLLCNTPVTMIGILKCSPNINYTKMCVVFYLYIHCLSSAQC